MSGPIVRRYGFPNFEKIFGERDLKHGAPEDAPPLANPTGPAKPGSGPEPAKADVEPNPPKP